MNALLTHGGNIYEYDRPLVDFSSNISPLGLPEQVKEALGNAIDDFARYPDPVSALLTQAIAKAEEVEPAWVHCGSGAAELIFRLAQAVRPARALLLAPTFSEYERALLSVGCEVSFCALYEKDAFAVTDKLLSRLDPALDMFILCNPNNPTGEPIDPMLLDRVAKRCAVNGILLVVDECFLPFLANPQEHCAKRHLAQYPQLVVLRAFTKLYAMAGIRLGYLLSADSALLERVLACEPPWHVSAPAQVAGVAALQDHDYVTRVRELVETERAFLTEGIRALGCVVTGSKANYIFFKCNRHRALHEQLLQAGILIRSCANYRGLDERFYRVAVRTHPDNLLLLEAMKTALQSQEQEDG